MKSSTVCWAFAKAAVIVGLSSSTLVTPGLPSRRTVLSICRCGRSQAPKIKNRAAELRQAEWRYMQLPWFLPCTIRDAPKVPCGSCAVRSPALAVFANLARCGHLIELVRHAEAIADTKIV